MIPITPDMRESMNDSTTRKAMNELATHERYSNPEYLLQMFLLGLCDELDLADQETMDAYGILREK